MSHPAIQSLDRQLARKGEDVVFERDGTQIPARAVVRRFESIEVAGGNNSQLAQAILSPTPFVEANLDPLPRRGDHLFLGSRRRRIEMAGIIRIADEVVRIELDIAG